MALRLKQKTDPGELRVKIRRRSDGTLRPKWVAVSTALVAAAFALALFWQHAQQSPIEAAAVSRAALGALAPLPEDGASASGGPAPEERQSSLPLDPIPVGAAQASSSAGAAQGGAPAAEEVPSWDVPYQVPKSAPVDAAYFDDALFVGDSITTGISLYHRMGNARVVAATGINPNTILHKPVIRDGDGALHTILETMAQYDPGKIYVQLGANGVSWIGRDDFVARYGELLDAIRAQHPDALLYVQSIFPVTREKSLGENGIYSNEKIDDYNRALMELCEERGIAYLNVAQALRGADGALPPGVSADGIHIGPAHYDIWYEYLRAHTLSPDAGAPESNREGEQDDDEKGGK